MHFSYWQSPNVELEHINGISIALDKELRFEIRARARYGLNPYQYINL